MFLIDSKVAASFDLKEPAVAFIADETLVPATQLLAQGLEDAGAIVRILSLLFFIEADNVTAALDFDLFDLEWSRVFGPLALGGDFLPASAAPQHHLADLPGAAHAHPHDVMNRGIHPSESFEGRLAHHPAIGYHAHLAHTELGSHALDDGKQALGVGRVARPHLAADGASVHIKRHPDNHLAQIGPVVLAVTVATDALPASSLEVNGGGVKEDQPHFAEQIAPAVKERLFDQVLRASGSP